MAFEQYYSREWKSVAGTGTENFSGCFDCNICLDFAREPVVTLCGHLYCWPCIYKWLHVQSASLTSDEHPQCPVCKADISHTTMVPLYGRGQAGEAEGRTPFRDMIIPPRPAACGTQSMLSNTLPSGQQLVYRNPYRNQHSPPPYSSHEEDSSPSPVFNVAGSAMAGLQNPMIGMFRGMVYARVFGDSEGLYSYPNSYHHLTASSSPRLRRHEMQADRSLNRILIFLFCSFILYLIVL
ncbi:E3 ubiquitin-protein ligase RMA1H1-like [Tripterygium wilfordii]|uniref:E3 ubiquitin-protein ligase RMA n=1 Tax=Tripterygium wilfordii TaxID=458696 RepID=A0A7J7C4H9_TRIWF|nr:E3 ubiquitin-protein ligase RMA1H1-like [Tripterygium wilfordii]KAF5728676.1 E3 ubiquitin-protein ligase RMA1H1-like [Tripterygium wilfordii]